MKVSSLISELQGFISLHGDCEVEFLEIFLEDGDDPRDLELHEIHDGYNLVPTGFAKVCELRFIDSQSA